MIPKFAHTPGCINRKIIDYKTEACEALYKQATRSLYSYSEGYFTLDSEGLLQFFVLITGHAKSCGWDIFDLSIATTGSIKELLGHYGEITLSDIKTHA